MDTKGNKGRSAGLVHPWRTFDFFQVGTGSEEVEAEFWFWLNFGRNKQAWHGEGSWTEVAVKKQRLGLNTLCRACVWAAPPTDLFSATWQLPAYMTLRGMSSRRHKSPDTRVGGCFVTGHCVSSVSMCSLWVWQLWPSLCEGVLASLQVCWLVTSMENKWHHTPPQHKIGNLLLSLLGGKKKMYSYKNHFPNRG